MVHQMSGVPVIIKEEVTINSIWYGMVHRLLFHSDSVREEVPITLDPKPLNPKPLKP